MPNKKETLWLATTLPDGKRLETQRFTVNKVEINGAGVYVQPLDSERWVLSARRSSEGWAAEETMDTEKRTYNFLHIERS